MPSVDGYAVVITDDARRDAVHLVGTARWEERFTALRWALERNPLFGHLLDAGLAYSRLVGEPALSVFYNIDHTSRTITCTRAVQQPDLSG